MVQTIKITKCRCKAPWNMKQIIDACIIQSTGKTGEIV